MLDNSTIYSSSASHSQIEYVCGRCKEKKFSRSKNSKWCRPCWLAVRTERRSAQGKNISIGSELICKNCGTTTIKIHKRQFYCGPCTVISKRESLPASRKRQLEYQKVRNKRLRRDNPSVAISERITAQIGCAIRSKKAGRKWESLVGYTLHDLMTHLERQFLKGMTWENRDKWHIDHILPISGFNLDLGDDEIKRAWGLPNLRPMWAADNIRKSGHRLYLC